MKIASIGALAALVTQAMAQTQYVSINYLGDFSNPGQRTIDLSTVPARQSITEITDKGIMGLLVACFTAMMREPTTSVRGYTQVCGIHGMPYTGWDGNQASGTKNAGYCTHTSQFFCDFHRPMLRLMELRMLQWAYFICRYYTKSYDAQATCYRCADQLALPYWDWAYETSIPSIFTAKTISCNSPFDGTAVSYTNPFLAFTIPSGSSAYNKMTDPVTGGTAKTTSRDPQWQSQVLAWQPTLQSQCSAYLQRRGAPHANMCTTNSAQWTGSNSITPLEGMHNTIHMCVGGWMNSIDMSSYDPIFWFHHCNVDRLYAMSQIFNSNINMNSGTLGTNTWVWSSSTSCRQNTPMPPFYSDWQGTKPYTPAHLTYTENLNYTYDCLRDNQGTAALASYVTSRYGSSTNKNKKRANLDSGMADLTDGVRSAVSGVASAAAGVASAVADTVKTVVNATGLDVTGLDLVTPPGTEALQQAGAVSSGGVIRLYSLCSQIERSCSPKGAAYGTYITNQVISGSDVAAKGIAGMPGIPGFFGGNGSPSTESQGMDMSAAVATVCVSIMTALTAATKNQTDPTTGKDTLPPALRDINNSTEVGEFMAFSLQRFAVDTVKKTDISSECLKGWHAKVTWQTDTVNTDTTQNSAANVVLDFDDTAAVSSLSSAYIRDHATTSVSSSSLSSSATSTSSVAASATASASNSREALNDDAASATATGRGSTPTGTSRGSKLNANTNTDNSDNGNTLNANEDGSNGNSVSGGNGDSVPTPNADPASGGGRSNTGSGSRRLMMKHKRHHHRF